MRAKCSAAAADDDEEDVTSRRIAEYKHKTLPVLGYLDDTDKLDVVLVIAVNHFVCLTSNSIYNSSCIFVFSLWTIIFTICTYILLCSYGLCYFAFTDCVIIIVVALFALHCYSAIRLSS